MNRSRGFTLLEVLVSVAILAMVSTLVYSSMSVTLSSQKEVMMGQDRYHAGRVAVDRMSRDLASAFLSKHVSVLERNRETVFLGGSEDVVFTYLGHYRFGETESPESDQGVVSYFMKTIDGKRCLVRSHKTIIDDRPEKDGIEDVLVEGVKKLEFEYYDPVAEDWVDEWKAELEDTEPVIQDKQLEKVVNTAKLLQGQSPEDEEFILPKRVRVQLILLDEKKREYPFLTETVLPMRHAFNW